METVKLGEVAQIVDCEHKTAPITPGGRFFAVGTPAMRGNFIDYSQARPISAETFQDWTKRLRPKVGDILFAREAPVGPVVQIPPAENIAPGQRTVLIRPGARIDGRYLFYLLASRQIQDHIKAIAAGSTVPHLNVSDIRRLCLGSLPRLITQYSIGEVLGSLDDKIAANSNAIEKALLLQSAVWIEGTKGVGSVLLGNVSEPVLGGTPPRKDEASWGGGYKWASVADMTASPRSHLLNTAETITSLAIEKRRFAPLPAGSVLLSARGTVGRVVSLVEPSSFNQSAYGFKVTPGFEAAFRLAVTSAVDELRAKSYGSVFSTITKTQINEASVPAVFETADLPLHHQLNSIESLIVALEKENVTLAKTRDELLSLLMNGKISVREAKQEATSAGADIPSEEIEA